MKRIRRSFVQFSYKNQFQTDWGTFWPRKSQNELFGQVLGNNVAQEIERNVVMFNSAVLLQMERETLIKEACDLRHLFLFKRYFLRLQGTLLSGVLWLHSSHLSLRLFVKLCIGYFLTEVSFWMIPSVYSLGHYHPPGGVPRATKVG